MLKCCSTCSRWLHLCALRKCHAGFCDSTDMNSWPSLGICLLGTSLNTTGPVLRISCFVRWFSGQRSCRVCHTFKVKGRLHHVPTVCCTDTALAAAIVHVFHSTAATAPGDEPEPVWRRLLRLHLDHPHPEAAQQAAAALAD